METNNKKSGSRQELFHCQDCDLTVHLNDKDSHVNGAKHKLKVRTRTKSDTAKDGEMRCQICDTSFTNLHFWTIHKGSKTHRRNVNRWLKMNSSSTQLSHLSRSVANLPLASGAVGSKQEIDVKKPVHILARRVVQKSADTDEVLTMQTHSDYKSIREVNKSQASFNPG